MKIKIEGYEDGDDDCSRTTYYTMVDGKEVLLAPCALSGYYTFLEIQTKARKIFGADVELEFSDVYIQTKY